MASQSFARYQTQSVPCPHCKAELTFKIAPADSDFKQLGMQEFTCPNCREGVFPDALGTVIDGPSVASHYGKQTHVACKKCGQNIFVTSARASLRNGERHVELTCNSTACGYKDLYNEVALEIHGD